MKFINTFLALLIFICGIFDASNAFEIALLFFVANIYTHLTKKEDN